MRVGYAVERREWRGAVRTLKNSQSGGDEACVGRPGGGGRGRAEVGPSVEEGGLVLRDE
jgi:hypothetical protein